MRGTLRVARAPFWRQKVVRTLRSHTVAGFSPAASGISTKISLHVVTERCDGAHMAVGHAGADSGVSRVVSGWTVRLGAAHDPPDVAEAVGDCGPWRQQAILDRGR